MAEANLTQVKPTKKLNEDRIDLIDRLNERTDIARAIFDAGTVLSALERATCAGTNGTRATGEGYADGYVMSDASLPTLLAFGCRVVDDIRAEIDRLADL